MNLVGGWLFKTHKMKITQAEIDKAQREVDKCVYLLDHITAMQKITGDYTVLFIIGQKNKLIHRFRMNAKILADAKAAKTVSKLADEYDPKKLMLDMTSCDARSYRYVIGKK